MRRGMVKLRETRRVNAHTHAHKRTEVSKIAEVISRHMIRMRVSASN